MEQEDITIVLDPTAQFERNLAQERPNWKLIEDTVSGEPNAFDTVLSLHPYLEQGEPYVCFETMMRRAKEMGNLAGQYHAHWLLRQGVPDECKRWTLIFPATRWQNPLDPNRLYAPMLSYDAPWTLAFGTPQISNGRIVRVNKWYRLHSQVTVNSYADWDSRIKPGRTGKVITQGFWPQVQLDQEDEAIAIPAYFLQPRL